MNPEEEKKPSTRRFSRNVFSQAGVSLLVIIIAILVLAILGAGMYALTSSSAFNQVSAREAMQAQYLADAGPRIVVGEFKTAVDKNAALVTLNGSSITAGGGTITLAVYPYWFYYDGTTEISIGYSGNITLSMPGNLPRTTSDGNTLVAIPASGFIVKITPDGESAEEVAYTWVSTADSTGSGIATTVTFAVAALPYKIEEDDELLIGFKNITTGSKTIGGGADLVLNGLDVSGNSEHGKIANFFPPENGNITVDAGDAFYDLCYDRRDGATLTNIRCAVAGCGTSFTADANTVVYIGKSLAIRSTGNWQD